MKFDLNKDFVNFDGNTDNKWSDNKNQAKFLSVCLSGVGITKFSSLKSNDWARSLFKTGLLEIDKSDLKQLIDAIEELKTKGVSNSVIASLQESLDISNDLNRDEKTNI